MKAPESLAWWAERAGGREWLDRLRQRFRIPEPVLAERRLRARQLGEAARVAQHQKRWSEAASSIRLAIAFDPWSEALKDQFGEIQAEVHRERAERLLEEAGALDSRSAQQALRLYDEVLHYRPRDAKAFAAAARVALEAGEGERAQEYAERACEIEPAVAAHALTLARALRRQGRQIEAKQAFEKARSIDPNDAGVLEELKRQRRKPGRG